MKILITGAAGMIGRKLTARLIADGMLNGRAGSHSLHSARTSWPFEPLAGRSFRHHRRGPAILAESGIAETLAEAAMPDVVFHLAGVVSGEAEAEFRQGLPRQSRRHPGILFDAIRLRERTACPRVVYSSSIAVFGAPFPPAIPATNSSRFR